MRTLIWKEFREHLRWLPIGLLVVTIVAWIATPDRNDSQTLVARDLVNWLAIVLPLLAFALGTVQSYRDLQPAAGDYLHHRSVPCSVPATALIKTASAGTGDARRSASTPCCACALISLPTTRRNHEMLSSGDAVLRPGDCPA